MATDEFSKFADILGAALSQRHLPEFEIAQPHAHAQGPPRDIFKGSKSTAQSKDEKA